MIIDLLNGYKFITIPKCGTHTILKATKTPCPKTKKEFNVSHQNDKDKYVCFVRDPVERWFSIVDTCSKYLGANEIVYSFWMDWYERVIEDNYMHHHFRPMSDFIKQPNNTKFYWLNDAEKFFQDSNLEYTHQYKGDHSVRVKTPEIEAFVKSKYAKDYEMLKQIKQ